MLDRMMWPLSLYALLYTLAFSLVHAQSSGGNEYFITPPATGAIHDYSTNPIYANGSELQLQWNSDFDGNVLTLYQNDNDNYLVVFSSMDAGLKTYNWTVGFPNHNESLPSVFFFRMEQNDNPNLTFSSHYFNITPPPSKSSSPSNSTSPVTPSASPTSGLGTGTKVGIAVAVALGVVAFLALAAGLIWYRKKASRVHHEQLLGTGSPADEKRAGSGGSLPSYGEYYGRSAEVEANAPRAKMEDAQMPPKELHATPRSPQEMHGTPRWPQEMP